MGTLILTFEEAIKSVKSYVLWWRLCHTVVRVSLGYMIRLRLCVHVFVHVYTLSPVLSGITPSLHVFIRFRRFVSFSCFSIFFLSYPTSYNSESVFLRFSPCLHVLVRLIMFYTVLHVLYVFLSFHTVLSGLYIIVHYLTFHTFSYFLTRFLPV